MAFDSATHDFETRGTLGESGEPARPSPVQPRTTIPRAPLPPKWLSLVEELPPSYQGEAAGWLVDEHVDSLIQLTENDAQRLGIVFSHCPIESTVAVVTRAARVDGPWLSAFFRGYLASSEGAHIRLAASAPAAKGFKARFLPLLPTPDRHRVLQALAAAGDSVAFEALERELVSIKGDGAGPAAARFRSAGIRAVCVLAGREDPQPAADVAVGLVEGLRAVKKHDELDKALAEVDPRTIPVEVVIAFLLTAKRVRHDLHEYDGLVSRLHAAMTDGKRADVADVIALVR